MKDKIVELYNNFNMDDMQDLLWDIDLLALLSHPATITVFIVLGLLLIYEKWRFATTVVLSNIFLYGYLFIVFVITKNSDITSASTFILLLSALFLVGGRYMYKHLIQ